MGFVIFVKILILMAKFNIGDKVKLISDTENNTPMTVSMYYVNSFEGQEALKFIDLDEKTP